MLILRHSHPASRKLLAAWQRVTAEVDANVTAAWANSEPAKGLAGAHHDAHPSAHETTTADL